MTSMLCFALAVDKSIVCNTTSPLQVSPKGSLFHLYLPHGVLKVQSLLLSSSSSTFQNPLWASRILKGGGATDLGYHIIYGSHIVRGALDSFIKVTGVKA